MSNNLETRPEARVIGLVSGIVTDVRVLINQQLALFRHEIKGEISHAREASSLMAAGFAIVLTGSVLLCAMLVQLLAWMAPALPLWGCYGIVGAPIAALGAVLCLLGIQKFKYFSTPTIEPTQGNKEKGDG